MGRQATFSDLEMEADGHRRPTRRRDFLALLDRACPWGAWAAEVERARADRAGREGRAPGMGRPAVPAEAMLRMYALQVCFSLSDEACEEQVLDSASMRAFVGLAPADVPDATSLCRFRRLLEGCSFGDSMLGAVNEAARARGLEVSTGTIVDATFVESPSSTKNAAGARDPDAHQAKKGQNWHFGYKLGVGVDALTGVPHSARVDPANASDLAQLPSLLREGDERAWLDAGYTGAAARPEVAGDPALSGIEMLVAARRSRVTAADLPAEAGKASVRSAVEHAFHVIKDRFGLRRTRLRGLERVGCQLKCAVALAAAVIADGRTRRPLGPPACLSADRVAEKEARLAERAARREREAAERAERERRRAEKVLAKAGSAPA